MQRTMVIVSVLFIAMGANAEEIRALVVFPDNYGANSLFYLNDFRRLGWQVTTTGTADTMASCGNFADPVGCPPIAVDLRLDEIADITGYDIVAIMSSAQTGTSPAHDLLESQHALDLIHTAADSGIVLAAWCASVRVLAAADVLDGITVTGSATYRSEYEAAGATYVGGKHYPVVDGTIVTCTRGRFYHQQNSNAVARAVEGSPRMGARFLRMVGGVNAETGSRPGAVWSTEFGGAGTDVAMGICSAPGGLAVTGLTYSQGAGMSDVLLALVESDGDVTWSRTFGGPGWECGTAICPAQGGGYLIAGSVTIDGAGDRDMLLFKTDEAGNEVWSHAYGGPGMDVASSVAQGPDGTIVVLGYTESFGAGEDDLYLVKTDAGGEVLWTKTLGSASSDMAGAITTTNDGNYVIVASTGGFGAANRDVWLVKLSAEGTEQWSRLYDGISGAPEAAMDEGHALVQTADGGFAIAGVSDRPIPGSEGDLLCAFLIRTDSTGTELWRRKYGENSLQDHARSLVLSDGVLILAGATTDAVTMRTDGFVVATDPDGVELWREIIGGDAVRWGNAITTTPGAVSAAGFAESEPAGREAWVVQVSTLLARFDALPTSGHAPLTVQFTDESLSGATSWSWDLDGDGLPESTQQNPEWRYDTPGMYSVSLTVANQQSSASFTAEECIRVFDGESAVEFNGRSGSVMCAAAPSLSFSNAVTVEALIRPCGWGESSALGYGRVVDKTSFALYVHGEGPTYNDHSLLFMIKNPTGVPRICSSPAHSVALDQWQHVAVTYDSAAGVCLLIDGVQQDLTQSAVPLGPIRDNAAFDLLVGNAASDNVTFDGVIDEVRIWNIARSPGDIQQWIHRYLMGDEDGLAGYWRMNEGYGDSLHDASPNGNHGIISTAVWAQGGVTLAVDDVLPTGQGEPLVPTILNGAPNPFTAGAELFLHIPVAAVVDVAMFDIAGRKVKQVMTGTLPTGTHVVRWDGVDGRGRRVAAGPYIWVVHAGGSRKVLPVIVSR